MHKKSGFTLTEVLVVVAILAILITLALVSFRGKRDQADDAVKKTDLERLKITFEDYYSDKNCYPPAAWFDDATDCASGNLQPYLSSLPCDKKTGMPYTLQTDPTGCVWFKFTAQMNQSTIPTNCPSGCTVQSTYSVSSDNISPYTASDHYWCSGVGNCSSFNPDTTVCTPNYTDDANCGGTPSNKCPSVGSCYTL